MLKRVGLFAWYMLGVVLSLPALAFLILTNWLGIRQEDNDN